MGTFHLQIVTPDGAFFDGPAERVKVRTISGDVAILARHIPYVTALGTGEATVTVDGTARRAAASGGMLSVTEDKVSVVATTFEWAEDIDVQRAQRAQRAREKAEAMIQNAKTAQEQEQAKARLLRALTRLKAAGK